MLRTTTTATTTTRGQAAATAGLGNASAGPPTRIDSDAELEIYHKYLASRVRSQSGDSTGIGLERTKQRHALYARAEVLSTRDVLANVI